MRIDANGQAREVAAGTTVLSLLEGLGFNPLGMVVERNGQIVDRETYSTTVLCEADRLELVRIVGGG